MTLGEVGLVLGGVADAVNSTVIIFERSLVVVEDVTVIGEVLVVDGTVLEFVVVSVVVFVGVVVVVVGEI